MHDWALEWFNSPLYLSVYKHRDSGEADRLVEFLLRKTSTPAGGSVLDLGCGAGRHSFAAAKKGMHVVGVDRSKLLLEKAKTQFPVTDPPVSWMEGDINFLDMDNRFDLILNIFTSFGYQTEDEDNFSLFQVVRRLLKTEGHFVFDYFNSAYLRSRLEPLSRERTADGYIEQIRWIEEEYCMKRIIAQAGGQLTTRYERVKMYTPERIIRELENRGFSVIHQFGDYEGNAFAGDDSPRLLLISRL